MHNELFGQEASRGRARLIKVNCLVLWRVQVISPEVVVGVINVQRGRFTGHINLLKCILKYTLPIQAIIALKNCFISKFIKQCYSKLSKMTFKLTLLW